LGRQLEEIPMQRAYIVTGTLTDRQTVALDEALPMTPSKVRVVVEPMTTSPSSSSRTYLEVIADIRARQDQRGFQAATLAEVDSALAAERESWAE
jgi:hypothetical protein